MKLAFEHILFTLGESFRKPRKELWSLLCSDWRGLSHKDDVITTVDDVIAADEVSTAGAPHVAWGPSRLLEDSPVWDLSPSDSFLGPTGESRQFQSEALFLLWDPAQVPEGVPALRQC